MSSVLLRFLFCGALFAHALPYSEPISCSQINIPALSDCERHERPVRGVANGNVRSASLYNLSDAVVGKATSLVVNLDGSVFAGDTYENPSPCAYLVAPDGKVVARHVDQGEFSYTTAAAGGRVSIFSSPASGAGSTLSLFSSLNISNTPAVQHQINGSTAWAEHAIAMAADGTVAVVALDTTPLRVPALVNGTLKWYNAKAQLGEVAVGETDGHVFLSVKGDLVAVRTDQLSNVTVFDTKTSAVIGSFADPYVGLAAAPDLTAFLLPDPSDPTSVVLVELDTKTKRYATTWRYTNANEGLFALTAGEFHVVTTHGNFTSKQGTWILRAFPRHVREDAAPPVPEATIKVAGVQGDVTQMLTPEGQLVAFLPGAGVVVVDLTSPKPIATLAIADDGCGIAALAAQVTVKGKLVVAASVNQRLSDTMCQDAAWVTAVSV